jgi:hypothetical protein
MGGALEVMEEEASRPDRPYDLRDYSRMRLTAIPEIEANLNQLRKL